MKYTLYYRISNNSQFLCYEIDIHQNIKQIKIQCYLKIEKQLKKCINFFFLLYFKLQNINNILIKKTMNKTSYYVDFQNKISHYNNLRQAKSKIQNNFINIKTLPRQNNKLFKTLQIQRKNHNKKLLENLLDIHQNRISILSERYSQQNHRLKLDRDRYSCQKKQKQKIRRQLNKREKRKNIFCEEQKPHQKNQQIQKLQLFQKNNIKLNQTTFTQFYENKQKKMKNNSINLNSLNVSRIETSKQYQNNEQMSQQRYIDIQEELELIKKLKKQKRYDNFSNIEIQKIIKSFKNKNKDQRALRLYDIYI